MNLALFQFTFNFICRSNCNHSLDACRNRTNQKKNASSLSSRSSPSAGVRLCWFTSLYSIHLWFGVFVGYFFFFFWWFSKPLPLCIGDIANSIRNHELLFTLLSHIICYTERKSTLTAQQFFKSFDTYMYIYYLVCRFIFIWFSFIWFYFILVSFQPHSNFTLMHYRSLSNGIMLFQSQFLVRSLVAIVIILYFSVTSNATKSLNRKHLIEWWFLLFVCLFVCFFFLVCVHFSWSLFLYIYSVMGLLLFVIFF